MTDATLGGGKGTVIGIPTRPIIDPRSKGWLQPTGVVANPNAPKSIGQIEAGRRVSPTDAPELRGRYAGLQRTNIITITTNGGRYAEFNFDRPYILQPLTAPTASMFYIPEDRAPGQIDTYAYRTVHYGIIFISQPGKWYIKNSGNDVDYLCIDASEPSVAARYLSDPGYVLSSSGSAPDQTLTAAAAAVVIAQANLRRGFIIIQNTGANEARIGIGGTPSNTVGLILPAKPGSITLAGDTCWKNRISGFSQLGTTVTVCEATEF